MTELLSSGLLLTVLQRWPSLTELKRVHVKTLRRFLKENGIANQDQQTQMIEAVRALAFKWIRIMFRLWKTNTIYEESQYIEQLKKRNSPLVDLIENP